MCQFWQETAPTTDSSDWKVHFVLFTFTSTWITSVHSSSEWHLLNPMVLNQDIVCTALHSSWLCVKHINVIPSSHVPGNCEKSVTLSNGSSLVERPNVEMKEWEKEEFECRDMTSVINGFCSQNFLLRHFFFAAAKLWTWKITWIKTIISRGVVILWQLTLEAFTRSLSSTWKLVYQQLLK